MNEEITEPAKDGLPMAAERPNVVLIVADDMGWGDLGCYGAKRIPTPAMDRLASEGVRATDCHSASSVCTPSRYAILTGRYAWRSPLKRHVLWGHSPSILEHDRPNIASLLRSTGYATGAFGKWHLGLGWHFRDGRAWNAFQPGTPLIPEVDDGSNVDYAAGFSDGPIERGFDRFFGIAGSLDMAPYCFLSQGNTVGLPDRPKKTRYRGYGLQDPGLQTADWRDEEVDARFTGEACSWIREQAEAGKPFFCYLALSAPHRPCLPPSFTKGRSDAGTRGDMVCVVDWSVGEIMAVLDGLGLAGKTLVIVTSDNGADLSDYDGDTHGHRANGDWRGQKADIYEGGHREPLIARWPGHIPSGTVTGELIGLIDLLPTIASAVGVIVPEGAAEDAMDVLAVLEGRGTSPRSWLVHHSLNGSFALRRGKWKLVMASGSGGFSEPVGDPCDASSYCEGQLYDLAEDAKEKCNLWDAQQEVVSSLYEDLKRIARGPVPGLSFDALGPRHERPHAVGT